MKHFVRYLSAAIAAAVRLRSTRSGEAGTTTRDRRLSNSLGFRSASDRVHL